jgi:hypothetical protein
MEFLIRLITTFEDAVTIMSPIDITNAGFSWVVTASAEQIPNTWTVIGLSMFLVTGQVIRQHVVHPFRGERRAGHAVHFMFVIGVIASFTFHHRDRHDLISVKDLFPFVSFGDRFVI